MKIKNMVLVIMACFLIFISMSCICASDDADMINTRDADNIIADDAIDDNINVIDDGGSSAADDSLDFIDDGGSSAEDIDVIDDGGSSAADDSLDFIDDGDSIIKNRINDIPKYNNAPISNIQGGQSNFGELQDLIDNLPAGSVLYLYGDYTLQDKDSSISISKGITINGNGHTLTISKRKDLFSIKNAGDVVFNDMILKSNGMQRIIQISDTKSLTCNKVTFRDAYSDDFLDDSSGGAVRVESTPVTFINCSFFNNLADGSGGAVSVLSDMGATFIDCQFKNNNNTGQDGGTIYGYNLRVINCSFSDCHSINKYHGAELGKGAAIYSLDTVCVENSIFKGNEANFKGGAIYSENGMLLINSTFTSNKAQNGGALFSEGKIIAINCSFDSNIADSTYPYGCGGAIYGKSVDIDSCSFLLNNAKVYGGAINAINDCIVKNSLFNGNHAGGTLVRSFGGAIDSQALLTVDSCKFTYNTVDDRGGALSASNRIELIGDNEFISNEAHDFGGAIYSKYDLYINWNDNGKTTFKSNKASSDSGGAIYSEKNVYVRNGMFDSNFAEDDGGAIFSQSNTYINWNGNGETIFKYNRANTDDGGSIYSKTDVYVKNSDFSYGYAHDGGAIFAEGNTIIDSSVFNVNYASHQGGAIYEKQGLSLRGRTSFAANEAKDSGGAIYTRKFDEDVWHATFRYNIAGDDGGAIYIDHENHETFTECDFEDNYAGDEGGAIYLDDGDSHLSLIRNNLVNNKAKSGYTVYNHGTYDDLKDNWHGTASPNFDNQFKKYRTILKDLHIKPSSYAKSRISW